MKAWLVYNPFSNIFYFKKSIFFVFFLVSNYIFSNSFISDSLELVLKKNARLTSVQKMKLYNKLSELNFTKSGEISKTYAQKAYKIAVQLNNDTIKANALRMLAISHYMLCDNDSTDFYVKRAINFSEKSKMFVTLADTKLLLAEIMMYTGKIDSSFSLIREAKYLIDNFNIKNYYTNSYYYLVKSKLLIKFKPDSSLIYTLKSLELSKREKDVDKELEAYSLLSNIYLQMGLEEKYTQSLYESIFLANKYLDNQGLATAYDKLSNFYLKKHKYDSCKSITKKLLTITANSGDKDNYYQAKNNLAKIFYYENKIDSAFQIMEGVLAYALESKLAYEISIAYATYAKLNLKLGKINLAEINILEAIKFAQKNASISSIAEFELLASEIYEQKHDFKLANFHLKRNYQLLDSLKKLEVLKFQDELLTKYDIKAKESMIRELEQAKQLEELNSSRKSYLIISIVIFFISVVIVAFFVFNQYSAKKKRQILEAQVLKQKSDTELISSELKAIKAQMNPHFLFNALDSIQELILTEDKFIAHEQVNRFALLSRKILANSTKKYIDIEDEISLLNDYLELEKLRFGDDFTYQIEVTSDELYQFSIPPMLVQPYVENAIKHGLLHKKGYKKVCVLFSIDESKEFLIITVKDNGIGLKAAMEIGKRKFGHQSFSTSANKQRIEMINSVLDSKVSVEMFETFDEHNASTGTEVKLHIAVI